MNIDALMNFNCLLASYEREQFEKDLEEKVRYKRKLDNLPDVPFPNGINNATEYFILLVKEGIRRRYGSPSSNVFIRIQQEMKAILSTGFEKYFLVWWKIAAICRENEVLYFCTSEANSSIICYVLEITDIDPLEHNLIFEYFFNAYGWGSENALISFCVSRNIIQYLRDNFGSKCISIHHIDENNCDNECYLAEIIITKKPVDEKEDFFCFIFSMPDENDSDWSKFSLISSRSFHAISYSDPKTISQFKRYGRGENFYYLYYRYRRTIMKLLKKFNINSFSDLLIIDAITYFVDDNIAQEIFSDLIRRKSMGYKPLFKGAEKILDETYGRILFEEQFILLVQLITGWNVEKAQAFMIEIKQKTDHRFGFIVCAEKSGFSQEAAEELYNTLYEVSDKLICKAFILPWVQDMWRNSYLRAYYPDVLIEDRHDRYMRMIDTLPDVPFPAGINNAAEYLTSLVHNGIRCRYGETTSEIQQWVQHEMDVILSNHFEKYFLIVWEITMICRKRGLIYSSGCEAYSSIVCYVLGITDIDPLEHNLVPGCLERYSELGTDVIRLHVVGDIIQDLRNIYGAECVAGRLMGPTNVYNRAIIITKTPVRNYTSVYMSENGLGGEWYGYDDFFCFIIRNDVFKPSFISALAEVKKINDFDISMIPFSDNQTVKWLNENSFSLRKFFKEGVKNLLKAKVEKQFKNFTIGSFSDLVILQTFEFHLDIEAASAIIRGKNNGYKPLFDGAETVLDETYGVLLYKEQFYRLVHLITGWSFKKARTLLWKVIESEELEKIHIAKLDFINSAKRNGFTESFADNLFKILAGANLVSKNYYIEGAKLVWKESYLRAHYPSALISKSTINMDK